MRVGELYSKLKVSIGWGLLFHPALGRAICSWNQGLVPYQRQRFNLTCGGKVNYQQAVSLFLGFYEKSERRLIRKFLRNDLDVIELGSGVGVISCAILAMMGEQRRLLCVEANPKAIPALKANVDRNLPRRKAVSVINQGISYTSADTLHFRADDAILGSRVTGKCSATDIVQPARLGGIYRQSRFERFALVCDIEGAEAGILLHDREILRHCDQIIAELHHTSLEGREYTVTNLAGMVERLGFRQVGRRHDVFAYERTGLPKE
jgi:FkbM family methyltransferase